MNNDTRKAFDYLSSRGIDCPKLELPQMYKPVGHWEIKPNIHYAMVRKPRLLTRIMAKIFFELTWRDYE